MALIDRLCLLMITGMITCENKGVTAVTVKEDGEAILDCSFGTTNIQNKPFSWKKDVDQSNEKEVFLYSGGDTDPDPEFKDRVSYFPDQLQFGNASIKITKAKTSDSGTYTCYHATVQKEIKSTISLIVDPVLKPRPEIKGASPKPRIESVTVTNNQVQLQCEVLGAFPKPEVVCKDSDGKILPADEPKVTEKEGNKFNTVLNVTVTKTDHYTCEATQKEIYHQINSSIAVTFNVSDGTLWGWIIGVIVALVAVLIVAAVFGVLYFRERNRPRSIRESQDNHDSSLHSSHVLAKPQETGEMMKDFRCESYDDHRWM